MDGDAEIILIYLKVQLKRNLSVNKGMYGLQGE